MSTAPTELRVVDLDRGVSLYCSLWVVNYFLYCFLLTIPFQFFIMNSTLAWEAGRDLTFLVLPVLLFMAVATYLIVRSGSSLNTVLVKILSGVAVLYNVLIMIFLAYCFFQYYGIMSWLTRLYVSLSCIVQIYVLVIAVQPFSAERISHFDRRLFADRREGSGVFRAVFSALGMPYEIIKNLSVTSRVSTVALMVAASLAFSFFFAAALQVGFGMEEHLRLLEPHCRTILQRGAVEVSPQNVMECRKILIERNSFLQTAISVFVCIILAAALRAAGRRVVVHGLIRNRHRDTRSPVVYLRAFDQDAVKLKYPFETSGYRFLISGVVNRTVDEILLGEASIHGPVIALADPRRGQIVFGPVREIASNDDWQNRIRAMLEGAKHIFIFIDQTEGISWELEQIESSRRYRECIFALSPIGEDLSNRGTLDRILLKMIESEVPLLDGSQKNKIGKLIDNTQVFGFCFSADTLYVFKSNGSDCVRYQLFIRACCRIRGFEDQTHAEQALA